MFNNIKKTIQFLVYFALPFGLLLISVTNPDIRIFKQLAELAWQLLILVLFIKPIILIVGNKRLMPLLTFRREMGIASFWFAIFHVGGMIYSYQLYSLQYYLGWQNFIFWGATGAIGYLIVASTSNNFAMRKLKRNWKKIQSLSYFIFTVVTIHLIFLEQGEAAGLVLLFIFYWILKILEWKKFKLTTYLEKYAQKSKGN